MEALSRKKIAEYLQPLAFARERSVSYAETRKAATAGSSRAQIRTDSMEASYRLVTGASSRLERIESNLTTMLTLVEDAMRFRNNPRKLENYYAQMRSLGAGVDELVDATQFQGKTVFTGSKVQLGMKAGSKVIDAPVLRTGGEGSLGLAQYKPMADIRIRYKVDDLIVNSTNQLVGLDITEATFVAPKAGSLELEDGDYKLSIEYAGEGSVIELRHTDGRVIERREGVDLSGNGQEWVDFDSGVRLSIEKENKFTEYDKYDYEENGPALLSASLNYKRVDGYELRTGEAAQPDGVKLLYASELQDAGGKMKIVEPGFNGVSPGRQELAQGIYQLEVEFLGENSVVRLRDNQGRLRGYQYGVDLSSPGSHKVNLGVGMSFSVDNSGFGGSGGTVSATVEYRREQSALGSFDFREYAKTLKGALEIVSEQKQAMEKLTAEIEQISRVTQPGGSLDAPSPIALQRMAATSILSGGSAGLPGALPTMESTRLRVQMIGEQIFASTNAYMVQANQTPNDLLALKSQNPVSLLSNFA